MCELIICEPCERSTDLDKILSEDRHEDAQEHPPYTETDFSEETKQEG